MRTLKVLMAFLVLLLICAPCLAVDSLQEANQILEKWTSFHWGKDCFVWIAHYSEDLVDPWVTAESARQGMTPHETEQYRESFISQLKMNEAEAFLLSIYYFGENEMKMAPFSEKIVLRDIKGEDHGPISYDPVFDSSISGVVQGLVFFSIQKESKFSLVVQDLGIGTAAFRFPRDDHGFQNERTAIATVPEQPVTKAKVTVIPLTVPVDEQVPETVNPVSEDVRQNELKPPIRKEDVDRVVELSKEDVISVFLDKWIEGDYGVMYSLLSKESRDKYSQNAFTASAMQSPFRLVLKSGYEIHWIDQYQTEVVAKADLMIMKTLQRRTFRMVEDGDDWRITW